MRIALVTPSFLPKVGGAEFIVHHLACEWHKQGHEVCVINATTGEATHAEGQYTVRGFKLLRGSTRFGYHRFPWCGVALRQLDRWMREFEPELTSAHFGYPTAIWLARLKPMPKFLCTCHGPELTRFKWGNRSCWNIDRLLADALNRSAGAVANSMLSRSLMEEMGIRPDNILDIKNGVHVDRFQTKVDFDLRAKLGLPRDCLVILSIGRNHSQKAFDTGIKAFAKVGSKVPEVRYVILGRDTAAWQPLADELGVGSQVVFCEGLHGDELIGAYQQADIFLSPSRWEMMSLVVLEAMASGLPEVVTDISGSQDVVHTGQNGIVVPPDEPDAMAEALLKLVNDEDLRVRMGTESAAQSKQYTWDRIARQYLEHA